jgi:RimJ/RimL family protein N-acetyltransferase
MIDQGIAAPSTTLRDGREVMIRPLNEGDRAALLAFGRALRQDDWLYMENDLQSPEIITRLVNASLAENWRQVVAVSDRSPSGGEGAAIVGYSAVRRLPGWSSHVADIHLIVSDGWRRIGLGTALAPAIFAAARDLGADKVIVELLAERVAGRAIFERLAFRVEGVLSNHARDRHGHPHNLLILAYHIHP